MYHEEQLYNSGNGEKAELFARLHHTYAIHMRNMIAKSKPSTTPELVHRFKFLLNRFLSAPQIVILVVEKPVIQEFVPLALNRFR